MRPVFLTSRARSTCSRAHPPIAQRTAPTCRLLLDLLAGRRPSRSAPSPGTLREPLKERELAVLRFLSTNLTAAEIGSELILSVHTVKTHMRKLYAKLDVHTRAEAVQHGRALGLLAPPAGVTEPLRSTSYASCDDLFIRVCRNRRRHEANQLRDHRQADGSVRRSPEAFDGLTVVEPCVGTPPYAARSSISAALHGVLELIESLGLELLDVRRIDTTP